MRHVPVFLGLASMIVAHAVFARGPAPSHMFDQTDVVCSLDISHPVGARAPWSATAVATRPVVQVPIDRSDGGLWVNAVINDRVTVRMLLDTGSSVVILPEALAGEAGLDKDAGYRRRLNTIQGTVIGRLVTLDEVALGNAKVRSVTAVVLDENDGEPIGLLGRSFLEHFTFQVDFDRNVLTLIPRGSQRDLAVEDDEVIENRLESLQAEQARAWMDPNVSPAYLDYLRRSVDYWASRRARRN